MGYDNRRVEETAFSLRRQHADANKVLLPMRLPGSFTFDSTYARQTTIPIPGFDFGKNPKSAELENIGWERHLKPLNTLSNFVKKDYEGLIDPETASLGILGNVTLKLMDTSIEKSNIHYHDNRQVYMAMALAETAERGIEVTPDSRFF